MLSPVLSNGGETGRVSPWDVLKATWASWAGEAATADSVDNTARSGLLIVALVVGEVSYYLDSAGHVDNVNISFIARHSVRS